MIERHLMSDPRNERDSLRRVPQDDFQRLNVAVETSRNRADSANEKKLHKRALRAM